MPTKSIALRIDTNLLKYLEARAEKEHRTLSNMIISMLLDEMERTEKVGEIGMNLSNFRTDRHRNLYGLKRCKYHCDYGDGEYCHYKEIDGCIYNKTKEEIDGQIKGRRMTDAESMGMLFDDPLL